MNDVEKFGHNSSALRTFDPYEGEPLLRIIDPLPQTADAPESAYAPHYARAAVFAGLLILPQGLFSFVKNMTLGGQFFGPNGYAQDLGQLGIGAFIVGTTVLLLIGRRFLGSLVNEVLTLGIAAKGDLNGFVESAKRQSKLIAILHFLFDASPLRAILWSLLSLAENVQAYSSLLNEGRQTWISSAAEPNSLFYTLHVGARQPNAAGIWIFVVVPIAAVWLVVLACRLLVLFACLCRALANSRSTVILPGHPDETGGLECIGRASLFFSLFTVLTGVDLALMSLNEIAVVQRLHPEHTTNAERIGVGWLLYFGVGTVLFFLPVLPLRARMASAKRATLFALNRSYRSSISTDPNTDTTPVDVAKQNSLVQQIRAAESMVVWPFDHKTFLRFAGVLIAPVTPLLGEIAPQVSGWLLDFMHFRK